MAVRYIKQRDNVNCGPVAIINFLKASGIETSPEIRKAIIHFCRKSGYYGTARKDFFTTLHLVKKMYFPKGSKVMYNNHSTL